MVKYVSQVDAIKHKGTQKVNNTDSRRNQTVAERTAKAAGQTQKCSRYGRGPHSRNLCPAKDAICHACKRKGHFKSQCYSTKAITDIAASKQELDNSDTMFLNTIDTAENSSWNKTILVDVCFKLDTGAKASVMSEEILELLGSVELRKPDQKPLEVLGELHANMSHKGTTVSQPINS